MTISGKAHKDMVTQGCSIAKYVLHCSCHWVDVPCIMATGWMDGESRLVALALSRHSRAQVHLGIFNVTT
jgi:hypothetical protein